MIVSIVMKNVRERDGKYEFRMRVPKDCQKAVRVTEVTQSLKTSDASEADVLSKKFTSEWKEKFKKIRSTDSDAIKMIVVKTDDTKTIFQHSQIPRTSPVGGDVRCNT